MKINLDIFEQVAYNYATEVGAEKELIFNLRKLQAKKNRCDPKDISEVDSGILKEALISMLTKGDNVDKLISDMIRSYNDAQCQDFI